MSLLEELKRRQIVGAAKARLPDFAEYASRGHWQRARHLALLSTALERVIAGESLRLIIEIPPRHGKSHLCSVYFPAWCLGRNPHKRVILASYAAELAEGFGRHVRNTLQDIGPELWGVTIADDSSARGRWDIAGHRGGMYAVGAGGPITGRGADLLIVDDPIKNAEEAHSQARRDSLWEWWQTTARTRLEPGGAAIVIMTRWHEDDLVGRLLRDAEAGGEQWHRIRLPAIAEDDDQLDRVPGKALWPERYDEAALADIRTSIGQYAWAALYQARPMPASGGIFRREWFLYCENRGDQYVLYPRAGPPKVVPTSAVRIIQSVDVAASMKQNADLFVVATIGVTPAHDRLVLDVVRTRVEGPDQPQLIMANYHKHRPGYVVIESIAYQLALIQRMRREFGLPIREARPDKDKLSRALPVAVRYEAGQVYHLRGAPWLGEWEAELASFPAGTHDDQVDAFGQAEAEFASGSWMGLEHHVVGRARETANPDW